MKELIECASRRAILLLFAVFSPACTFETMGGYRAHVQGDPEVAWAIIKETALNYGLELDALHTSRFKSDVRILGRKLKVRLHQVSSTSSVLSVLCDCEKTASRELIEAMREDLTAEGISMEAILYPSHLPLNHPGPVLTELWRRNEERR